MTNINDFRRALAFTLKWEGGYSNYPDDPGEETKWGIAKRYHPELDIRNLTAEQAASIYAAEYWDAVGCDAIPFPECVAVFDTAVNLGVGRVRGWLKDAPDAKAIVQKRVDYYYERVKVKPTMRKYLNGWLNRVNDLKKFLDINASQSDA